MKHLEYTPISFQEASKRVVEKIVSKYENIFIPLSGGMDSEYVFECFKNHRFTPIIVDTPANKLESSYAFRKCKETGIEPVVISLSEKELLLTYYEQIYKRMRGCGYNSTATYIAGKYAEEHNGNVIIAEGPTFGINNCSGLYEYDFYNDALIHEENSIYFFMYDIEIFSAMINEYRDNEDYQLFKQRIYNIPLRPKMKYQYSEQGQKFIDRLTGSIS